MGQLHLEQEAGLGWNQITKSNHPVLPSASGSRVSFCPADAAAGGLSGRVSQDAGSVTPIPVSTRVANVPVRSNDATAHWVSGGKTKARNERNGAKGKDTEKAETES